MQKVQKAACLSQWTRISAEDKQCFTSSKNGQPLGTVLPPGKGSAKCKRF